jgi:hypothetical protein
MPQDRESGLRASRYGKAGAMGAQMLGNKSNECVWNNQQVLIKSGHRNTRSVGVLYHIRSTPTRSHGSSAGRAGMIPRKMFEEEGQLVGIVYIEESSV